MVLSADAEPGRDWILLSWICVECHKHTNTYAQVELPDDIAVGECP